LQALALPSRDRQDPRLAVSPRLHFDDGKALSAARNNVDLTHRRLQTTVDNSVAEQAKLASATGLGPATEPFRAPPSRTRH
jgi:hypothetical protein